MEVYFLDFGVVVFKNGTPNLVKYYETKRLFSIIKKLDNKMCFVLNIKSFPMIDRRSKKKIKYWSNKVKKICYINYPHQIECLIKQLSKKYDNYLYTED